MLSRRLLLLVFCDVIVGMRVILFSFYFLGESKLNDFCETKPGELGDARLLELVGEEITFLV